MWGQKKVIICKALTSVNDNVIHFTDYNVHDCVE